MYRKNLLLYCALISGPGICALTGCAPVTNVVMLPQPGHSSVVEVTSRQSPSQRPDPALPAPPTSRTLLLTHPYESAHIEQDSPIHVEQLSAAQVDAKYHQLLAVEPPAPRVYQLFFLSNGTELTEESADRLEAVITSALASPGNEIVVTGYADSVGTDAANDRLSLHRAQVIRQAIIDHGFDAARVYAVGRGSHDPLVQSGSNIAEQKNRRVEIIVR